MLCSSRHRGDRLSDALQSSDSSCAVWKSFQQSALSLQQQDSETLLAEASSCSAYSHLFHIFLNDYYPDFTCVAYWIGILSSKHSHPKRIKSLPTTPRHVWLHRVMDSFQRGDYLREKTCLFSSTFLLLAWTSSIFLHWHSDSAVASAIRAQSLTEELGGYLLSHFVHRSLDPRKCLLKSILGVSSAWVAIWALCTLQTENHKLKFGKLPTRILWLCEKRENKNNNKSLRAIKN